MNCAFKQAEFWLLGTLAIGIIVLLICMEELLRRLQPRVVYVHQGGRDEDSERAGND